VQSTSNDTVQLKAVRASIMSSPTFLIPWCRTRLQHSSIKSTTKMRNASLPLLASLQTLQSNRSVTSRVAPERCIHPVFLFAQVRQLAAVELRKRISQNSGDLWMQCNNTERNQIKAKLPEVILAEQKYVFIHLAHQTSSDL
jgi:hypothetical protein